MQSGFNLDGTATAFTAQISSIKRIGDFSPQNLASAPPYTFGFYQMLYNQISDDNLIQLKFALTPNKNFTITISVSTNVFNSTFSISIAGHTQTVTASHKGFNLLAVSYSGNPTGQYSLTINPEYRRDATTFLLTEIVIEEN